MQPVGPVFSADSAYAFCEAQCDFGPRVMNSVAHDQCEQWIISKFQGYGMTVATQKADLRGYDGTTLKSTNIIASYKPEATQRILLCAHWDSRPWADNDPDEANHRKPVMAANDGASGVAVMLEVARLLSSPPELGGARGGLNQSQDQSAPDSSKFLILNSELGIDFVCFDAEDWGTPQWSDATDDGNSWALGAQYWAANLSKQQASAYRFGILLDMVGGEGAQFYKEGMSVQYASRIVDRVWRAAQTVGFGSLFPSQTGGYITDDHLPVNQKAKIPCIDIIPYYPNCEQSSFGPTWHTVSDDMSHIDRNTLQAVGQTMIQVLFSEK